MQNQKINLSSINEHLDRVYDSAFFNTITQMEEPSAQVFAEIIIKYFKPHSIIDFGCGNGIYLKEFIKKNISGIGIEGSRAAIENSLLDPLYILLKDLSKVINLNQKFDLALCIEVAEHLKKDESLTLVKNLIRHSNIIIFTAAIPGQTGVDHINEQPKEYWINIFKKNGYMLNHKKTGLLLEEMTKNNVIFWIVNNLMVFEKKDF